MRAIFLTVAFLIAGLCGATAQTALKVIGPVTPGNVPIFNSPTIVKDSGVPGGAGAFANPTASVGLTAVNGVANTAMRSDAAPPLSAPVQSALTGNTGQILVGTGGFGFAAIVLGGDCTFTSPNVTCTKLNGVSYGAGPSVDTVPVVTAANMATYTAVPNCTTGVLQYSTATHLFTCGATGSGSVTSITCDGITITVSGTCPPRYDSVNLSITASVSGNNLTVAVKDNTGADCSATSPCSVWYRDFSSAGSSKWAKVDTTAALSFTANAGSTFGVANTAASCLAASSCPFKLWIVMMNSGSGNVIGVVNLTNASGVRAGAVNEGTVKSSTACSACATATAIGTLYSTAAQTNVAIKIIGYCEWGSGLATAGTYASTATSCQTLGPGIKRPGDSFGSLIATTNTQNTVSSTTFASALSQSISPTMASNLIRIRATGGMSVGGGTANGDMALRNNTTILNTSVRLVNTNTNPVSNAASMFAYDAPGSTSSQSYNWANRGDGTNSDTLCFAGLLGTDGCTLEVEEIMG